MTLPPVLTKYKQNNLENWIVEKTKYCFPMHKDHVKDAVYNLIKEIGRTSPFVDNHPGHNSVALSLKRSWYCFPRLAKQKRN